MIQVDNIFKTRKAAALQKWKRALENKQVDLEIIDLVEKINVLEDYYTTSSCAGRLTIISKEAVRSKYRTDFIYKTHNPSEMNLKKIGYPIRFNQKELWMLLEPPNFHVGARSFEKAIVLVKLAQQCGLGKSKYQSISPALVVEILGTGTLSLPLGKDGQMLVSQTYVEEVLRIASEMLMEEQKRLRRFEEKIDQLN
ncbi:MAG: hypothetical protein D6732_03725 [Methanobacteriota archaeon]|nr:MAG: hypothetical protein D6732_03725 [Euryarchaeota archaeon]